MESEQILATYKHIMQNIDNVNLFMVHVMHLMLF